jgi:hypothetical protein
MTAMHVKLGVKYAGTCAVCGKWTGDRGFEREGTSLYKRSDGQYCVVHPACAGGNIKSRIQGGTAYRDEPADEIEVKQ